jgi:hypothetical protein
MEKLTFPLLIIVLIFSITVLSCKKEVTNSETRTYRMGFQNSAPRVDFNLIMESLNMWTQRADAAMITTEVPWDSLLSGKSPQAYVTNNYKLLVDFYRSKNLKLWVYIDPANGLDRASDATYLVSIKKSIAQPAMQKLYRRFAFVMDSMLHPDHLGLALETNLIRGIASDSIYQGVKNAANMAAQEIQSFDSKVKLSVSVQAEWAWGKFNNSNFQGIDQDLIDFPFLKELGISSYPYIGYKMPQDIPNDYYTKLIEGKSLPVFISEGGWTSANVSTYAGTPELQKDYIIRQGQLLDLAKAIAYFQLTFTDIDLSTLPGGTPTNINLFAFLGMVDMDMKSKPALSAWDELYKKTLVENN